MANVSLKQLKLKYTKTAGKLPTSTDITEGELALNLTDKRIYSRIDDEIVELGGVNGSVTGNIDVDGTVKAGSISLDNPVDIVYGGTGSKTKEGARTNLEVYSKGETDSLYVSKNTTVNGYKLNQNITLTSSDTGSLSQANNLSDVKNINTARSNINAAKQGVNTDITEIAGLNTALSILQGGTGSKTKEGALSNLGGFPIAGGTISGDVLVTGKIMDSGSQQVYSPNNKPSLEALSAAKSGANSDITSLAALTSITKGLTLSSTLTVSDALTVNKTSYFGGNANFNTTVGITGNTTIGGNTYISGLATVAGTLGVTGRTTLTGLTINHNNQNWLDITGAYSPTTNQYMTNGIRIWNRENRLVDLYNFESVGNYSALTVHVYNSANSNEAGAYYEFRNSGLFVAPSISSNTTIAAGADIRARGSMYVGNGDTRMAQDGNIWGTRWNGSGEWLFDWMNRVYLNDVFLGGQQWWATPPGNARRDWALGGGAVCTGYTQTDEGSYHIWIDGMFYRPIWKRYGNGSQSIIAST